MHSLRTFCTFVLQSWVGLGFILALISPSWAQADEFLPPDQAFAVTVVASDAHHMRFRWQIASGYHLYAERFAAKTEQAQVRLLLKPRDPGELEFDENFQKQVRVLRQATEVEVEIQTQAPVPPGQTIPIQIHWQGCADSGLCYLPASAEFQFNPQAEVAAEPKQATTQVSTAAAAPSANPDPGTSSAAQALASGSFLKTVAMFALAGLMLSLTPCVLPMLPIVSALVMGRSRSQPAQRGHRGLWLAAGYALGMSTVYAMFGVAAGLAGEGLAGFLQNPWVLGGFSVMLALFALSMFGLYDLQLPSAWQTKVGQAANAVPGGSFLGALAMGGLSALLVGPCVAAPFAGALVYISQTRDLVLGGSALFAMGLGMSVPLLLIGASADRLLPKAGAWMVQVKQGFGVMLLGVAIHLVEPILPGSWALIAWALLLMAFAVVLGFFAPSDPQASRAPVPARALGLLTVVWSVLLLIGAATGAQSPLQPLEKLAANSSAVSSGSSTSSRNPRNTLAFAPLSTDPQLQQELRQARQLDQWVMLDFYAQWCSSCHEMDRETFSDAQVQAALKGFRLLRVDVTDNNPDVRDLLKRFGLFGPPGIVFIPPSDQGLQQTKTVIGFESAETFRQSIARLPATGRHAS